MVEPPDQLGSNRRSRNEGWSFSNRPPLRSCIAILLLILSSAILYRTVDDGLGIGWPHNVIRNWEQYGLLQLKAGLVFNPGGFEALDHPAYYPGHRAASLYPALILKRAFAWTGTGMLPFFITLSLTIFISVWWLMGRHDLALLMAGVASLSPSYFLFAVLLDPNTMAALAGLPFAAVVFSFLRRPRLSTGAITTLTFLIAAYSSINWSSALVHGAIVAALWVSPGIARRRLLLYVGLSGACALLVVAFSVMQKYDQSTSTTHFLAGYTWGNIGYGQGLTTARAIVRLATITTLGLFPLFLLCVFVVIRSPRAAHSGKWLCVLPMLTTILGIGALRNYFGHHPWMAGPFLLVGVVLSLWVWMDRSRKPEASRTPTLLLKSLCSILTSLAFLAGVFGFTWAVLFCYRSRQENIMPLINLVRLNTERGDTLIIERNRDPALAREVLRFEEVLDRHIEVIDTLGQEDSPRRTTLLLTTSESGARGSLAGRSSQYRMKSLPWMERLLTWYGKTISHRRTGDRIELAPDYLLYRIRSKAAL